MTSAYSIPNQGGTLPSTAADNGVGALALTDCAVSAVSNVFRNIVSGVVAEETSCSFVTESRSRASSSATDDEDNEESESEDEDCEDELSERTKRRIEGYKQRQRQQMRQREATREAASEAAREAKDDERPVDYNHKESVAKFYPKRKGKSPKVIPIGLLKKLSTDAEKHSFCVKWRNCSTSEEQKALKERCLDDVSAKKRTAKEAKARDQRMKKKQEEEAKAERKRKREEASEEKKRERDLRRNANKRKKTADKNAAKEQEDIVSVYSCY